MFGLYIPRLKVHLFWYLVGLCLMLEGSRDSLGVAAQVREEAKKASIYHVASTLVLVDVKVTDKHNRPVLNLSPSDFIVFEDDIPQTIESFKSVSPRTSDYSTHPVISQNENTEYLSTSVDSRGGKLIEDQQYMVLLLDYATTELENQIYIRPAAQRYFREHMAPSLQIAVVRVGLGVQLLQDFTNQPQKIVAALARQDPTGSGFTLDKQSLQRSIDRSRQAQASLQQDLNSLTTGSNSSDPRAGSRSTEITALLGNEVRQEKRAFATLSFDNQQQSRPILEAIRTIADSVASLPGRKSLILISRGFSIPEPLESLLYNTTEAANRARLSIYSLDSGGLRYKEATAEGELHQEIGALQVGPRVGNEFGETEFDRARQVGSDQQDSTLRYLSSATGGLLIRHTNDFEGALNRIDLDSHSYYLLSYRPRRTDFDGKFRHIHVAVNKPGLDVRARPGYLAMPPGASALSPSEFQQLLALSRDSEVQDFPLYAEPVGFLEIDGTYTVELPVELPQSAATRDGGLRVFGLVRASNGDTIASFHYPSNQRGHKTEEAKIGGDGSVSFVNDFHMGPGIYAIDLEAVDGLNGQRSYRHASLYLAPVENTLAVSSLTLSHRVEPMSSKETSLWKVGNGRIVPSSDRRFQSFQNLIYYFDVYYPDLNPHTGHPEIEVTFSLQRDGHRVDIDLPPYRTSDLDPSPLPLVQVARYLRLAGLTPGAYLLRAHIQDRVRGQSVSTQASFELVP